MLEGKISELKRRCSAKKIFFTKDRFGRLVNAFCRLKEKGGKSFKTIVAASRIIPHYHKKNKEMYRLVEGSFTMYKDGELMELKEGDEVIVNPYEVHAGEGRYALFEIISEGVPPQLDYYEMLDIPFVMQPDEYSCTLASNTMVANYFFEDLTLNKMQKVVRWRPGLIVWSHRFWLYIIRRGVRVVDYDLVDLKGWAERGEAGLRHSIPLREFEFVRKQSDLEAEREAIAELLKTSGFVYHRRRPTYEDLKRALRENKVIEVTLNPYVLENAPEFSIHRVVVVGFIEDVDKIVLHDPDANDPGPFWGVDLRLFLKAWLEALDEPELAVYERMR